MESTTGTATLVPRVRGRYLAPMEVVRRVEGAFAYVETTEEDAHRRVLEWMSQLAFVSAKGRAAADDDYLAELDRLQDDACFVHFADDLGSDGKLLRMLMMPRQPLSIEHEPDGQSAATQALIARCAAALDYEIVEPGNVAADARSDSTCVPAQRPERRRKNRVGGKFIPTHTRGGRRSRIDFPQLVSRLIDSFWRRPLGQAGLRMAGSRST